MSLDDINAHLALCIRERELNAHTIDRDLFIRRSPFKPVATVDERGPAVSIRVWDPDFGTTMVFVGPRPSIALIRRLFLEQKRRATLS